MIPPIIKDLFKIKKFTISMILILSTLAFGYLGPYIYPINPNRMTFYPESPPSPTNPLGTDSYGRDMLAQIIHGIKSSFEIGATAAIISLAIGVTIGAIAGFKGGLVDEILMLITNVILLLPSILLMLLIAAYFKYRSPFLVSAVIGITSWPWVARAVRSQALTLKEREFIYMSKIAGLTDLRIIIEDILPNMASYIFMAFVLLMSGAMLAEAGLSMIGLGLTEGTSLGRILFWAQMMESVRRGLWWWFVPPGAVLVVMTTSLMLVSTSLDEYFSPRLRGEGR